MSTLSKVAGGSTVSATCKMRQPMSNVITTRCHLPMLSCEGAKSSKLTRTFSIDRVHFCNEACVDGNKELQVKGAFRKANADMTEPFYLSAGSHASYLISRVV